MTTEVIQHRQALTWAVTRGWRFLPCHPRSKAPLGKLVPNGVHAATSDREVIAGWVRRYPDANLAVACGAPGPQVLDIDRPEVVPSSLYRCFRSAPRVKTARGSHLYFAGTDNPTVALTFGELRGIGSYVLIPPSVHPGGAVYEWLTEPYGPLPAHPAGLTRTERVNGAGRGEHVAPVERVPYGQRHEYLKDFALHLLRGRLVDVYLIEEHLRCEFERVCEPLPVPGPGDFRAMAWWAVHSRIAERERARNGR